MPPPTPTPDGPQPPPSPPDPVALDSTLVVGATFFGKRVLRSRYDLEDGRVVKVDLPTPTPTGGSEMTPAKRRLLQVLQASPIPLGRKELANKMGVKKTVGRFGVNVREMLSDGIIFEIADELSDSLDKFDI